MQACTLQNFVAGGNDVNLSLGLSNNIWGNPWPCFSWPWAIIWLVFSCSLFINGHLPISSDFVLADYTYLFINCLHLQSVVVSFITNASYLSLEYQQLLVMLSYWPIHVSEKILLFPLLSKRCPDWVDLVRIVVMLRSARSWFWKTHVYYIYG